MRFCGEISLKLLNMNSGCPPIPHTRSRDAMVSEQTTGGLMAIMNDDVNQLERFLDRAQQISFRWPLP